MPAHEIDYRFICLNYSWGKTAIFLLLARTAAYFVTVENNVEEKISRVDLGKLTF